jgi:hypothetical protein
MRENIIAMGVVALFIPAVYFGWLGLKLVFTTVDPNDVIAVSVRLENRCDLDDNVFVAESLTTGRTYRFNNGKMELKLPRKTKLMLTINKSYPGFEYTGIPQKVENTMTLVADCSVSPRLQSTMGAMKEQFNTD